MKSFTSKTKLLDYLKKLGQKSILLVVPAISTGTPGLNAQYKDYLDQSLKLYEELANYNFSISIFMLGAEHRGDGFLHKIGKDYLIKKHNIPSKAFLWGDDNFRKMGLCSVEEAELLKRFLSKTSKNYLILTCISKSQLNRYFLHHQGYKINSVYYAFPDSPDYYHFQNLQQEKILTSISQNDPTWATETGRKLRQYAHLLRDPKLSKPTREKIQEMHEWLSHTVD